jgi:hypothetical protein
MALKESEKFRSDVVRSRLAPRLSDHVWSILFALSVGLLMMTVLLVRSEPVPGWAILLYPITGGLLALAASRTSPSADQIAWIESSAIAAAAVVVLAGLVNLLLLDMLLRQIQTGTVLAGAPMQQVMFFVAPGVAVLLWWALQRRLSRLRLATGEPDPQHDPETAVIPAE